MSAHRVHRWQAPESVPADGEGPLTLAEQRLQQEDFDLEIEYTSQAKAKHQAQRFLKKARLSLLK